MKEISPEIIAFHDQTTNELKRLSDKGLSNIECIQILATLEALKMNFTLQLVNRWVIEAKE